MKNNLELQKDVQDALKWEPLLHAAEIGVSVDEGIVTLTGVVDSYSKKTEAEDAAKSVAGVKAVVEKIEIKLSCVLDKKDDEEIASEIVNAFRWSSSIPNDVIKVMVEKGWVTLTGEVKWNFQRVAATASVKNLLGVTGISNNLELQYESQDFTEKDAIEQALRRNWSIYVNDIHVKVSDHKATLTGTVDSWFQKNEAGRIAYNAPGVYAVDNALTVDYNYAMADL